MVVYNELLGYRGSNMFYAFFLEIWPPRNANKVEPYTFVMLFPGKLTPAHPPLHYVTPEWPHMSDLHYIDTNNMYTISI